MCRLFGLRANRRVDIKFSMLTGPKPFQNFSFANPDGWGMGWYEGRTPHSVKEPVSAACSDIFPTFGAEAHSRIFICHVRKATYGSHTVQNCHPFEYRNWIFAHNGSIYRESLLHRLNMTHREALKGETDSEVYFHWILQCIETKGRIIEGIRSALWGVPEKKGLNFILSGGKRLYAYRYAWECQSYYSLYYLERNPCESGPAFMRSRETAAMLESKALLGQKAVLVCSEKLTDENWQEIPLGKMLVVERDLTCDLMEIPR